MYSTFSDIQASTITSTSGPTCSRVRATSSSLRRMPSMPASGPWRRKSLTALKPSSRNQAMLCSVP